MADQQWQQSCATMLMAEEQTQVNAATAQGSAPALLLLGSSPAQWWKLHGRLHDKSMRNQTLSFIPCWIFHSQKKKKKSKDVVFRYARQRRPGWWCVTNRPIKAATGDQDHKPLSWAIHTSAPDPLVLLWVPWRSGGLWPLLSPASAASHLRAPCLPPRTSGN